MNVSSMGIVILLLVTSLHGNLAEPFLKDDFRADTIEYSSILYWGSSGTGDGEFSKPQGVCIDNNGYAYVADGGYDGLSNYRVQKFTTDGVFVDKWGTQGSGPGQFRNRLMGITTDSQYVYVVDHDNYRIQKFTLDGDFVLAWGSYGSGPGQFISAHGITVDRNNCIYVVDDRNHRIQKFTSDSTYLKAWYCGGSPRHAAVDTEGYVYITDHLTHVVRKYDSSGTFIMSWGGYGTGDGQFSYPAGIAIDNQEYIYVADQHNHRVQKFTSAGNFVTKFGTGGYGWPGEMASPWQLTVDKDGYVYVSEGDGCRIHKWGIVPSILQATINIDPNTLNLKSNGKWVTCYIELPAGYDVEDIDKASVALTSINDTVIEPPLFRTGPIGIGDYDWDSIPDLMVKFDRQTLIEELELIIVPPVDVRLTVKGALIDETQFEGTDVIHVIKPGSNNQNAGSNTSSSGCYISNVWPNPCISTMFVICKLYEDAYMDLRIYDVNGRLIKVLAGDYMEADEYELSWDGKDTRGNDVKNGVYFCKMTAGGVTSTKKLLKLK